MLTLLPLLAVLALKLSSNLNALASVVGTTVTLDYATLTGVRNDSAGIISYLGIPFADPPIGDLRWRAPVFPPTRQLGKINATKFGNVCIATSQTKITPGTSEDCLFGNIYIPIVKGMTENTSLPVMVWFHGGGYQGGNSRDSPAPILQQAGASPVIFASFEYRVGQFGFLGGSRVQQDGALNAGLLDQRAALRWIQRYVSHFGGDKSRVTIWGQSAGAGSTMFHLLANGGNHERLFRAAMGDSPALSFIPSYTDPYVEGIFNQFASFAGCGDKASDTMACLRSTNGSKLALAGSKTISARTATLFTFAPIADDGFLSERPVEAFKNGHFAHVPVLFGSNTDDGAHWSASLPDESANTSAMNATETTVYNFIRGQFASFSRSSFDRAVSTFYPLSNFNGSFNRQGQQMYGEMRYICTAGLITGALGARNISAFQFQYNNPDLGSFHGFELAAFFPSPTPAKVEDQALFTAMRQYWTSFVASGRPVAGSGLTMSWAPVSSLTGSPKLLLQPGNITMESKIQGLDDRCAFWHSISGELDG